MQFCVNVNVSVLQNRRILEFLFEKLFKVNIVSQSNHYFLVIILRHHLSERQEWRIIGGIKRCQTQMKVVQVFNSPQSIKAKDSISI